MRTRKLVCLAALATILSACVLPDPYRKELYRSVPDLNGDDQTTLLLAHGNLLAVSILSSGIYDDEAFAPYRVSVWLLAKGERVNSARIKAVEVMHNGKEIDDVSLRHLKSRTAIHYGEKLSDLYPAPCCVFMTTGSDMNLVHSADDTLTVTVDVCVERDGDEACQSVNRAFRGVVEKGIFQLSGV